MTRLRSPFTLLLGAVVGALCLLALPHLGVAHAHAVPDPVATSATSVDVLLSIALTYGPLWGGMAIGFGIVSTLLQRNESTHWIAQGRTLALITAAVGLGIAALQAHFGGAPWGGVLMTLVLGIFKLIDPTTVPPAAVTAKP
jgi:hypothetical protein